MSALEVSTQPTSLASVEDQCAGVEVWGRGCESIPDLRDAANKLSATRGVAALIAMGDAA